MEGLRLDADPPHLVYVLHGPGSRSTSLFTPDSSSLLRGGHFADFTIQSRDCDFRASRAFLFCQSGYFRRLLLGDNKEVVEAKIDLDDVPACLMARFLVFCYDPNTYPETIETSTYAQSSSPSTWRDSYHDAARNNLTAAKLAIKLYELGDRFDAQELKSRARHAFLRAWTNADGKEHSGLTPEESSFYNEACKGSEAFANLIKQVYSTTYSDDRGLRDIVFRTMKWHMIYHHHYMPDFRFTQQIVEDNTDVAVDLALHTISRPDHVCEECKDDQRFVVYPCSCKSQSPYCEESACITARRNRVFCFHCCKFGTFSPDTDTKPGNEED